MIRFPMMRLMQTGDVPIIAVDRSSKTPLYRQLYEGYREAILTRRLRPGERLPSTRRLAKELSVSRIPVLQAFELLLAEGYCEGKTGAGTFVSAVLPPGARVSSRGTEPLVASTRRGVRTLSSGPASRVAAPEPWLKGTGPFHLGRIALERFPFAAWGRLLAKHARRLDTALLGYGEAAGLPELREAIAAYVRTARGVACEPEQVLVVNGSQQALDLVARVLLEPGSRVFFEEPGYWGARDAFLAAGARLVPVPVDAEGLDVKAGIALCPNAQAAYVTPSHQFPTGVLMTASRRLELLQWARTSGAWIVEDDYDSEYRYDSLPVAALQGLDRDARVLYVGTFSKVLAPGLRIGYLVVPPDLVERFRVVRWLMDICPPALLQAVLADFLVEGSFARHLRRMRALYRDRRAALVDAIRSDLGPVLRVEGERAGLHLLAVLTGAASDRELAYRAAEDGLNTLPLSSCYLGAAKRQGFVLGYGGTEVEDIPGAVRRLARVLRGARPARREAG